jgi:tryptophan-rich sensory protein
MTEYIPIILPSLLGYGTAMFCKVTKDSGINVSIRPPPIIFSIVWPILYLMLGFSWFYARKNKNVTSDLFYTMLILLLSVWLIVYSCKNNKKLGIYVLIFSIIASIFACISGNFKSRILILPLIAWLIFATILNIMEVKFLN